MPPRRNSRSRLRGGLISLGLVVLALAPSARAEQGVLRVCADPNNLPFSNQRGEGFENKLAALVAEQLGETVSYTWWAQRRGSIRHTLKADICDVLMGVPTELDMVATTAPYYRSTYVFLSRTDRALDLASMRDPRLSQLRIGVHLIGDDGFNTPPAQALGEEGIVRNVVGYTIYGDYREPDPPARLLEAVARGDIDVAAAWGPLAGYFARHSPVPLTVVPITDTRLFAPLRFQFAISMGVRKGDRVLLEQLNQIIARKGPEIRALLASYGVPQVGAGAPQADVRADRADELRGQGGLNVIPLPIAPRSG